MRASEWDLVVADISLPGMSGLDLIKEVRRIRPDLPTLVLSMHPASQFARRALSAGAIGYLTKDSELEEFVTAIEEARRGRRYIGRDTADVLVRRERRSGRPRRTRRCRIASIRSCACWDPARRSPTSRATSD